MIVQGDVNRYSEPVVRRRDSAGSVSYRNTKILLRCGQRALRPLQSSWSHRASRTRVDVHLGGRKDTFNLNIILGMFIEMTWSR
jgi:hypothetical protein